MKKLLVFGSFFLVSLFAALTGSNNAQADGYDGMICESTTLCVPGVVTGEDPVTGETRCCIKEEYSQGKVRLKN